MLPCKYAASARSCIVGQGISREIIKTRNFAYGGYIHVMVWEGIQVVLGIGGHGSSGMRRLRSRQLSRFRIFFGFLVGLLLSASATSWGAWVYGVSGCGGDWGLQRVSGVVG